MRCSAGSGYSINLLRYGILKMVKLGIKRLKAKLWLKLWLKIPKRILLTRFNINFIIGLNAFFPEFIYVYPGPIHSQTNKSPKTFM